MGLILKLVDSPENRKYFQELFRCFHLVLKTQYLTLLIQRGQRVKLGLVYAEFLLFILVFLSHSASIFTVRINIARQLKFALPRLLALSSYPMSIFLHAFSDLKAKCSISQLTRLLFTTLFYIPYIFGLEIP